MAADSRRVTVTTAATRLDSTTESDRRAGKSVSVYNDSAVTVYIGGSDVDVSQGTPVAAGEHYAMDLDDDESVWGRVTAGTAVCRVFETGL